MKAKLHPLSALVICVVALLLSPIAVAQQPVKIPKVGFLYPGSRQLSPMYDVFRRALADLGYVEGSNIMIEPRFCEGQYDRCAELAADLVSLKVDVLAVQGAVTVREIKGVIANTPTIFAIVVDPIGENVVADTKRPGGNLSGVTIYDQQQPRKQLALLKEALPNVKRLGLLGDAGIREDAMNAREEAAHALGLQTQRFRMPGAAPDWEAAFAVFREQRSDAVLVMEEPVPLNHRKKIAELGLKYKLPIVFPLSGEDAGGLLAYGTSFAEGYRRMAAYVDMVLKGAKAGELPVEAVNHYELVVNLKTAQTLGITVPSSVLQRSDRIIK